MPKTAQERVVAPAAAKGAVAPRVVVPRAALPTPSSYMSSRSLDVIPLRDPPESHGRMLPHATHGPMATCSGTDRHITDHVRERWTDGVRSTKWVSYAKMCVARVEMSGHEESEACQRGPRPTPRSRLDPTRPPPGAAHVRCHWRVLPYIRPDPVTPGPARPTAGDRARTVAWLLGLRGRATPSGEIRFDLLNYALGSPCQPATTSPAIHRAT